MGAGFSTLALRGHAHLRLAAEWQTGSRHVPRHVSCGGPFMSDIAQGLPAAASATSNHDDDVLPTEVPHAGTWPHRRKDQRCSTSVCNSPFAPVSWSLLLEVCRLQGVLYNRILWLQNSMQPPALHNIHAADGKRHVILCMKLSVAHHHLTLQSGGIQHALCIPGSACKRLAAYLNILYTACFRACSGQAIEQNTALFAQKLQRMLSFLLEGNFAPRACTET